MADFYPARSATITPLPWSTFAPPFQDPEGGKMLVEFRATDHQTVFPGSTHQDTGETIAWENGCDGEPAAVDAVDLLNRVRRLAAATLVARAFPEKGSRDDFCRDLGGFLYRAGLDDGERRVFIEAVARAGGSDNPAERAKKGSIVRQGATVAGFPKMKELIGEKRAKAVAKWLGYNAMQETPAGDGAAPGHPSTFTRRGPVDWVTDSKGRVAWCVENGALALETHADWENTLAYNEFTGQLMLLKPIPGAKTPRSTFRPRETEDKDIIAAQRWFNRNGFPDAARTGVGDVLLDVAHQAIISPVRHYLEALVWDGVPRIGTWLPDYTGAEPTPFVLEVGRRWLISAVARALRPGCKADHVLILEGPERVGKSTLLMTLAGDDWFFDGLRDFRSKDASSDLLGKWLIELPELAALRRSDVETVKAYISRTHEKYRPAYGRVTINQPRRCIFAGTTNRSDYLLSDTGDRRFWPVRCGKVDIAAAARDRDQIWAEAVTQYRAGERWWLSDEVEVLAAAEVAQRHEDDPWAADVLRVVAGLPAVSTRDVLQHLEVDRERWTKADAMRIGGMLTRNGWRRDKIFTSGPDRGLARYVPRG